MLLYIYSNIDKPIDDQALLSVFCQLYFTEDDLYKLFWDSAMRVTAFPALSAMDTQKKVT